MNIPVEELTQWRTFWLGEILDGRYVVAWFFPLLPILMLLTRDRLRIGIIATGLAFVGYAFGIVYLAFWLVSCVAFYYLGERFARECKRTDVLPIGPPLAAMLIIGGWHVATLLMHEVELPAELNSWLYEHLRSAFPLGTRGAPWEPIFAAPGKALAQGQAPQLVATLFGDVHLIGSAYLTVRMLHYYSELKRDGIPAERRTLLNFLAYVCYAPNLIQGPIERYLPFHDEMDACHQRRGWHTVVPAAGRIGLGVLKSIVVTWFVHPLMKDRIALDIYYKTPAEIDSTFLLCTGVILHIGVLYLLFSGYCDVSAGMARLLGYRQVENFNHPYLATSFRDFWRRWHISLSFILRDYVYIALGGNRRHIVLNLVITFVICGLWHWLSAQVALWGLAMGLMVAINHVWVQWMKQVDATPTGTLPAIRRAWLRCYPLPQICAWLLTQIAFLWTILILFGGGGAYRVPAEIIRRFGAWIGDMAMGVSS